MNRTVEYRPEVDGLRAISVGSVLLYHYGIGPLSGGFVGVDVFFVISGFLITSIIAREMELGTYSVAGFYDRRVRRILPATLTVIAATAIAGFFILLPHDYSAFGTSALYSALGFANFYFLGHSGGYFDSSADLMPLLHLWSLAVEEQFYLIWPFLLAGLLRFSGNSRKFVAAALCIIILASLAGAAYTVSVDRETAFYMLHTRAWELALGALLVFVPKLESRWLGEAATAVGLALIVYAIFALSADMPFPGLNALYPCVGAALVIWPKSHVTMGDRLLSLRPMVFVGQISFSLYLWHWPVLVLYRQIGIGAMPPLEFRLLLAALAVLLAILSWRFVEQPFRTWKPSRAYALFSGAAGMLIVAAASFMIAFFGGLPARLPAEARAFDGFRDHVVGMLEGNEYCFVSSKSGDFQPDKCYARSTSKPNVLLVGNSHAAHVAPALRAIFPEISLSQVTASGCHPVLPVTKDAPCEKLLKEAFENHVEKHEFDAIILASNWKANVGNKLRKTVSYLLKHAKYVYVLGPTIQYKTDLPILLAKYSRSDGGEIAGATLYKSISGHSEAIGKKLEGTRAIYIPLLPIVCPEAVCRTLTPQGVPMQFDDSHFTKEGSLLVMRELRERGMLMHELLARDQAKVAGQ